MCETYARFGKPLHFTEVTVLSGQHGWQLPQPWQSTPEGEQRQAEYAVQLYTLRFLTLLCKLSHGGTLPMRERGRARLRDCCVLTLAPNLPTSVSKTSSVNSGGHPAKR